MQPKNSVYVPNRAEWRDWLSKHHADKREIWLIYYKKHTGKPRVPYDDAVEEALCFGWIDSTVKRIDDETYAQKFTPRNDKSNWSELNKKRVAKLTRKGLMTEAGLAKVRAAKKLGMWNRDEPSKNADYSAPPEFTAALKSNRIALNNFDNLAPSHRQQYIGWIASAKRPETRDKRIQESIRLLEQNQKLGMK